MLKPFVSFLLLFGVVVYWLSAVPARADSGDVTVGAFVNGQCVASQSAALDLLYSSKEPQVYGITNGGYYYSFYGMWSKVSGSWSYFLYISMNGGTWSQYSTFTPPVPVFPSCTFDPDYSAQQVAISQELQTAAIAFSVSSVNSSMSTVAAAASSVAASVASSSTFDLTNALAAFAFFFSVIILIFMTSHSAGEILRLIRGGRG